MEPSILVCNRESRDFIARSAECRFFIELMSDIVHIEEKLGFVSHAILTFPPVGGRPQVPPTPTWGSKIINSEFKCTLTIEQI